MSIQRALLEKLQPWLDKEHCRTCECLQAALSQIEFDSEDSAATLTEAYKVPHGQMHSCLGCNPCSPAEALTEYIRRTASMQS